eukprot:scaffold11639_cov65-Phaeocystis_antarctica.AAC.4
MWSEPRDTRPSGPCIRSAANQSLHLVRVRIRVGVRVLEWLEPVAPPQQVVEEQLDQPVVAVLAMHLQQDLGTDGRLGTVDGLGAARRIVGHHASGRARAHHLDVVG